METKHIIIDLELKKYLDFQKLHEREPYNNVLRRLLKIKKENGTK